MKLEVIDEGIKQGQNISECGIGLDFESFEMFKSSHILPWLSLPVGSSIENQAEKTSGKMHWFKCLLLVKIPCIHLKTEKFSQSFRHLPTQKADILMLKKKKKKVFD